MLIDQANLLYYDRNQEINNSKRIQNIVNPYLNIQNLIPELNKIKICIKFNSSLK
jgi:hypothetical protein